MPVCSPPTNDVELAVTVAADHRRQGLGSEVASAVVAFAFGELGLPALVGTPGDDAARALCACLGMERDGGQALYRLANAAS